MKKRRVTLSVKSQLRETIVYAADQSSAMAIARAQFVGAEVCYVVEAKWAAPDSRRSSRLDGSWNPL